MLLVSIIDTQLRYLILLTRVNGRKAKKVDPDLSPLFQQRNNDIFISERQVIKLAKKEVDFVAIDKTKLFKRIEKLYDFRNRAVHRFAITSFQYADIKPIVKDYEDVPHVLGDLIERLEQEQAELGVGFTEKEHVTPLSNEEIKTMVKFLTKTKINPEYREISSRTAMFSDEYEDGINPILKNMLDKEFSKDNERSED